MLGNSLPRGWWGPGTAAQRSCGAPSLAALKARLDGALGSLSWCGASLHTAGDWDCENFKGPVNPSHSVMILWLEMVSCNSGSLTPCNLFFKWCTHWCESMCRFQTPLKRVVLWHGRKSNYLPHCYLSLETPTDSTFIVRFQKFLKIKHVGVKSRL